MKHFKIFSLSPAMCLFLVACGGGSSTSNEPSPVTVDTSPPVITVTGDTTVNHEQGTTYSDQGATAQDAVDGSVTITVTGSVEAAAGTYTLTYSATDKAGNTATASRTIIVADTIAPTIALIGSETIAHEQGTNYVDAGATATDAVDDSVEIVTTGTLNTAIAGTYTLTYTATDQAGNISSATRTLVVADTAAPVITLTGAASINHEQGTNYVDAGATATDAVDDSVEIVTTGTLNTAIAGTYTLTYTATDQAGNISSATRTLVVADTAAPVITLTGAASINHEQGTSYVDTGATATDAVDDSVAVVITGTVNTATAGTYTLTYTATDQAGNISSTTRTLVVADTTGPLITVPTDISVESSDNGTTILATDSVIAAFLSAVTANDTVDGSVTVTSDAPDVFSVGATTVTFFAIDAAGNSTTSYAIVSVSASTAVVRVGFRLPAAITVIETVE